MCKKPHICMKWCAFCTNSNVCVILYLCICFVFVKGLYFSNKYLDNNSMYVYLLRRSTIIVKRIRRIRHEHVWNKEVFGFNLNVSVVLYLRICVFYVVFLYFSCTYRKVFCTNIRTWSTLTCVLWCLRKYPMW